jgi:hypothetical protein
MYWYHAHGGSSPAATRFSAQFRSSDKHLSTRLSMTKRFKNRARAVDWQINALRASA